MPTMVSFWFGTALVILVLGTILSTIRKNLLGIPNLMFEIAGILIISFLLGQQKFFIWFVIIIPAAFIAALYDPFIWKKQGYVVDGDNVKKDSWSINMKVLIAGTVGFFAGYLFS